MIKSKFYKDIQEGKTTLKTLYEQKAVFLHRDKKTFEYVYFYDWTEEVKKAHPEFSDYEIRALSFNGECLCSGTVINERCLYNEKKHYGYFFWSYSNKEEKNFYNKLLKANNLPEVDFPF